MASQDGAKTASLKESVLERTRSVESLAQRIRRKYRRGRWWASLLGFESPFPLGELVDLVVTDRFFHAKQVPSELAALGEILLNLHLNTAAEIGTFRGGTLLFLTRLARPSAKIVSIDLPGGRFGGGYGSVRAWLYRRFARAGQRIYTLRGDSHSSNVAERLRAALGGKTLDYLFIDGDHTYAGVKRDFELYAPLVRKGGVITFHDIMDGPPENVGGVPLFWSEIKTRYRHAELVEDRQRMGYGIGVLYVN